MTLHVKSGWILQECAYSMLAIMELKVLVCEMEGRLELLKRVDVDGL